jgi:hypothetical protein
MPTFLFFKNGKKIDEVVGAGILINSFLDIGKVESIIRQNATGGGSSMPSSGGRVVNISITNIVGYGCES